MVRPFASRLSGNVACLAALLVVPALPVHGQYTFTKIADSTTAAPGGGTFFQLVYPSINNNGSVVFFAASTAFRGTGLQVGGTGGPQLLANVVTPTPLGGSYDQFDGRPAINNTGVVGFQADVFNAPSGNGLGLFAQTTAGATSVLFKSGQAAPGGGTLSLPLVQLSAGINNHNESSFMANISGGSAARGIFKTAAGPTSGSLTQIAVQGAVAPGTGGATFNFFDVSPGINDAGQVCFSSNLTGGASSQGIFVGNGASLTPVAVKGGLSPLGDTYTGFTNSVYSRINNNGRVLFDATHGTGAASLFTLGGGPGVGTVVTTGDAAPGGGAFQSFDAIDINNQGTVVFSAGVRLSSSTSNGIFTGGPGGLKKVVRVGDSLFGSTVKDLEVSVFSLGLNDSDQVAFGYGLADGRYGIAVASLPMVSAAAPEPGSLVLFAFALLSAALLRCSPGQTSRSRAGKRPL